MGVYIELPKEWAKWSLEVTDVHDNILEAKATDIDLVRCGECKYIYTDEGTTLCGVWGKYTFKDGFCYQGERRADDNME